MRQLAHLNFQILNSCIFALLMWSCLLDELQQQFLYVGGLLLLIRTLARVLVWWLVPLLLILISLISPTWALHEVSSLIESRWPVIKSCCPLIESGWISRVVALESMAIWYANIIYFSRGVLLACTLSRLMCPSSCGASFYLLNRRVGRTYRL